MTLQDLIDKNARLAVVGLGYVGLPVALAFSRRCSVIGFDTNSERIRTLKNNVDYSNEILAEEFYGADIVFTDEEKDLSAADFFIVTVPTPVDDHNVPDLTRVFAASESVGRHIKKKGFVVFESTVYPGCTEEECIPIIEKVSGLTAGVDFKFGYSSERINPGDKVHTFENVIKVVSGCDAESLHQIAEVYGLVIKAGVYKASSVKVAEAAKVIENTQRDLNIALMNELSIICDKIGINTYEVLEAAGTKWNFLPFRPGLVGGHCIGVDPYYLTYKANELGFNSRVITAGRYVNDTMGNYISKKVLRHLIMHSGNVRESKVLIMGITFKENVTDVRNSKVADIAKLLLSYHLNVEIVDPLASKTDVAREYGLMLIEEPSTDYDAVIIAVAHKEYTDLDNDFFLSITKPSAIVADLKGLYRNKITGRKYWSL